MGIIERYATINKPVWLVALGAVSPISWYFNRYRHLVVFSSVARSNVFEGICKCVGTSCGALDACYTREIVGCQHVLVYGLPSGWPDNLYNSAYLLHIIIFHKVKPTSLAILPLGVAGKSRLYDIPAVFTLFLFHAAFKASRA
jgi:hypothetical protein